MQIQLSFRLHLSGPKYNVNSVLNPTRPIIEQDLFLDSLYIVGLRSLIYLGVLGVNRI
jgi:hypothetical protein